MELRACYLQDTWLPIIYCSYLFTLGDTTAKPIALYIFVPLFLLMLGQTMMMLSKRMLGLRRNLCNNGVRALQIVACIGFFRSPRFPNLLFFLLVLYFFILSGGGLIEGRLRLPMVPFIYLLASSFIFSKKRVDF